MTRLLPSREGSPSPPPHRRSRSGSPRKRRRSPRGPSHSSDVEVDHDAMPGAVERVHFMKQVVGPQHQKPGDGTEQVVLVSNTKAEDSRVFLIVLWRSVIDVVGPHPHVVDEWVVVAFVVVQNLAVTVLVELDPAL